MLTVGESKMSSLSDICSWMNCATGPSSAPVKLLKSMMALVEFMWFFAAPPPVASESRKRTDASPVRGAGIGLMVDALLMVVVGLRSESVGDAEYVLAI